MTEQSNGTRLKIEDELAAALDGEKLKNAMEFIDYMKINGMPPQPEHTNAFFYKGEWVCIICIIPIDDVPG
jgi:hypothetical protein